MSYNMKLNCAHWHIYLELTQWWRLVKRLLYRFVHQSNAACGESDRHLHRPAPSSAPINRWYVGLLCGSQVYDISVLSAPLQTRKEPTAVYRIVFRLWRCVQVFGRGETLTQISGGFEIATMEDYWWKAEISLTERAHVSTVSFVRGKFRRTRM
jgi:hypothetical protein